MSERRVGVFTVSLDWLGALLALPAEHQILHVGRPVEDIANDGVTIIVAGPTMPAHREGERAHRADGWPFRTPDSVFDKTEEEPREPDRPELAEDLVANPFFDHALGIFRPGGEPPEYKWVVDRLVNVFGGIAGVDIRISLPGNYGRKQGVAVYWLSSKGDEQCEEFCLKTDSPGEGPGCWSDINNLPAADRKVHILRYIAGCKRALEAFPAYHWPDRAPAFNPESSA